MAANRLRSELLQSPRILPHESVAVQRVLWTKFSQQSTKRYEQNLRSIKSRNSFGSRTRGGVGRLLHMYE